MAEVNAYERSDIDKEACAWIAQFDGAQPSAEDLEAFREWINRSPRHQEAIERLSELWGELNALTRLAVPAPREPRPRWRLLGAASMVTTVLLALAITLLPTSQQLHAPLIYTTSVGEQRSITLPDGSQLQLNTATQLQILYGDSKRELFLLTGEAFFDVSHDPQRPFIVHVNGKTVRAVGTAFSIRREGQIVEVLVTGGTVELRGDDGGDDRSGGATDNQLFGTVSHGHRIRIGQTLQDAEVVSEEELTRELAWRDGMLSFSGEPLVVVIAEIGRYTETPIVIEDPALEELRIGGYFRAGDTETMLHALESGFPIEVYRSEDGSVRLRARQ